MIATNVVAASVDLHSGPNKCPCRVTSAPLLDRELRATLKNVWLLPLEIALCVFANSMQNNRLFVFHFPKKYFEKIKLLGVHHSPMGGRATKTFALIP